MKWIYFLCLFLLTGCQMALDLSMPPESASFTPPSPNTEQRQLAFAGGFFDMPRGELYAVYPFWHFSVPNVNVGFYVCNSTLKYRFARSKAYWNEDDNIFGEWPDEVGIQVEKSLAKQGYHIKQHRQSYFADKYRTKGAELLLSLRVIDMKFNMCVIHSALAISPMGRSAGNGTVTVEWEVYDTIRDKILGSYITQGYGHIDEPLPSGDKAVFISAIHNAAENLGETDWFKRLMTTTDPSELLPSEQYRPLTLTRAEKTASEPIRRHFNFTKKSLITIQTSAEQNGSGFFINREGYALTTARLVGDAKVVQIMDSSGTKYSARVIRTHTPKDIALIKADITDNSAFPISNSTDYKPLTEVYALGTPYSNSYRGTIVRGMISSYRYRGSKGNSLIQADIPTASGMSGGPLTDEYGNVIGLAKSISDSASETHFSLFTPIHEALKALNITLTTD